MSWFANVGPWSVLGMIAASLCAVGVCAVVVTRLRTRLAARLAARRAGEVAVRMRRLRATHVELEASGARAAVAVRTIERVRAAAPSRRAVASPAAAPIPFEDDDAVALLAQF